MVGVKLFLFNKLELSLANKFGNFMFSLLQISLMEVSHIKVCLCYQGQLITIHRKNSFAIYNFAIHVSQESGKYTHHVFGNS